MVLTSAASTTNVAARSKARKRALDILFEADQRSSSAFDVLARLQAETQGDLNAYVSVLVNGVMEHQAEIDDVISTYSQGWTIERMPAVDRCLARIGVYELIYQSDIPEGVTLDEIVTLAADVSTDESPAFLNGLLAKVAAMKDRLGLV